MAISTINLDGETVNMNTFKVLRWALKAHLGEQQSCWTDTDFPTNAEGTEIREIGVAVELVASFLRDWMFHPVSEFRFWQAELEAQIKYDW